MGAIPDTLKKLAVPVSDLRTYEGNANVGDLPTIEASLTANGQYRPIVVNKGTYTSRPNEVLAGNHTLIAARNLGWPKIAVTFVDVDADQARRIVLVDNKAPQAGHYEHALAELVEAAAAAPAGLEGTGFDSDELAKLLAATAPEGDGFDDPPDRGHDAADVGVTVGEYRFTVTRGEWTAWLGVMRARVGFETEDIKADLRERLGFDAA